MFTILNLGLQLLFAFQFSGTSEIKNFQLSQNSSDNAYIEIQGTYHLKHKALLASRIDSISELRKIIRIEYYTKVGVEDNTKDRVELSYLTKGIEISATLEEGISQGEIVAARDGSLIDKIRLLYNEPYAIKVRNDLKKINLLAKRFRTKYGDEDLAFYDLAEASVSMIVSTEFAFLRSRDSSEKGFINTFNHITAQALISSIFGSETANFVAIVHERENMPELVSKAAISEIEDNDKLMLKVVDNYIDLINNKLGQKLGEQLKLKYKIHKETHWDSQLLTDYLNDLQAYYRRSFDIGMRPFHANDKLMIRFARKLNMVLGQDEAF